MTSMYPLTEKVPPPAALETCEPEAKTPEERLLDGMPGRAFCLPSATWLSQHEIIAGLRHCDAEPAIPCQDAAASGISPFPFVIVADGAGSAAVSDWGARAVVVALSRLLKTLHRHLAAVLDEDGVDEERGRDTAHLLVNHAQGTLVDLAQAHRRPVRDLRCTLLLAVRGRKKLLWLKVGDGALVLEKMRLGDDGGGNSEWSTLGKPGKGVFANETVFVDDGLRPADIQYGLVSARDVCAVGAMSDGAALALVSHDGKEVSSRLSQWSAALRAGTLKRSHLTRSFYDGAFARRALGDDCALALVSCALEPPTQHNDVGCASPSRELNRNGRASPGLR